MKTKLCSITLFFCSIFLLCSLNIQANSSIDIFLEEAQYGDTLSQLFLGDIYLEGKEVPQNIQKAIFWYEKAVKGGEIDAAIKLAQIYHSNSLGSLDEKSAFQFFKVAADSGVSEAQFMLGEYYSKGKGTNVDVAEGKRWYKEAYQQGHVKAIQYIDNNQFNEKLALALNKSYSSAEALNSLVNLPKTERKLFSNMNANEQDAVSKSILEFVSEHGKSLFIKSFEKFKTEGIEGYKKLNRWQSNSKNIIAYMQQTDIAALVVFETKLKHNIEQSLVAPYKSIFINEVINNPNKLSALDEAVKFEYDISEKLAVISNSSAYLKEKSKRENKRQELVIAVGTALSDKIKAAKYPSTLNKMSDIYFYNGDVGSKTIEKLLTKIANKKIELTAFEPTTDDSRLSVKNFTSKGLNYETELLAIYLGDFKNARIKPKDTLTYMLYKSYLEAYGRYCDAYLPSNKVAITTSECSVKKITKNGYGRVTGESCSEWVDVPTGLYANPELYSAYTYSTRKMASNTISDVLSGGVFSALFKASSIIATTKDNNESIGNDMNNLVQRNKCDNAGLTRFVVNFIGFMVKEKPLLLPGKEILSDLQDMHNINFNLANINFKKLLDDLIEENAKGWQFNIYRQGSVYNISGIPNNKTETPTRMSASYSYDSVGGGPYAGSVTLTFSNGIPKCLYFSDASQVCRHASRGIISNYEKGKYSK